MIIPTVVDQQILDWLVAKIIETVHPRPRGIISVWIRAKLAIETGKLVVKLEDYKTVLYRQEDGSWVADIPAISGCYALMPTRESALAELSNVFQMLAEEYSEKGIPLPADTTEIVHA